MKIKRSKISKKNGIVVSIGIGVAVSIIVGLAVAAVTASLLNGTTIGEDRIQLLSCIGLLIASLIGSMVSVLMFKSKYVIVASATSCIFMVLLVCANLLLFDGTFSKLGIKLMMVIVGSAVSCVIGLKSDGPKKVKKYRSR